MNDSTDSIVVYLYPVLCAHCGRTELLNYNAGGVIFVVCTRCRPIRPADEAEATA